ncbi:sigma-54 interaction domain-containing protein [Rhodocyclus tenuis]|uniref:DNA-binding NtrC family response regulator n=1 Tax=Rhodocyclus tenuis TaxID=1066 RepID=A0A840GCC9_RHOTE|nr:sigma-54-dependent Fis family transcriptional regulator [Rhodocyclus tenuis]MBB4248308.1 DNA-binding NtrC family response regulator [Rhodocyclus tenuis]
MAGERPELPELVSFLETLPEPHILCDRNYRIVAANAAYRANCGSCDDVAGRSCYEVSHRYSAPCDQSGESCPLARSLKSGQRERVLHLHHTPAGEKYENIELSPVRDADGEIAWFVEKLEPLPAARGLEDSRGLIGRAPTFRAMLELVYRVAPAEASVLLQGESGVGKELVAQAIHEASRRAKGPFVAVDCSGLAESLFESELFGHERGSFTGAAQRKIGLVEAAAGGTLFLDELGDIPLTMQVKLLRLLETGAFRRVGSTELRRADIRLISATHQPLARLVERGEFRQDLYYRLNTFPIRLPALRERRDDIPLLVAALLKRVAPERELGISDAAMDFLLAYDYPGNVRQLRNLLERASLLCDGDTIQPQHLADEVRNNGSASPALDFAAKAGDREASPTAAAELPLAALLAHNSMNATRENTVAEAIARAALLPRQSGASRRALAESLGISERTLYRRLSALRG